MTQIYSPVDQVQLRVHLGKSIQTCQVLRRAGGFQGRCKNPGAPTEVREHEREKTRPKGLRV